MEYFAETEKAVKLRIRCDFYNIDANKECFVWVPKSQLDERGVPKKWITDRKAEEVFDKLGGRRFEAWLWADGRCVRWDYYEEKKAA